MIFHHRNARWDLTADPPLLLLPISYNFLLFFLVIGLRIGWEYHGVSQGTPLV